MKTNFSNRWLDIIMSATQDDECVFGSVRRTHTKQNIVTRYKNCVKKSCKKWCEVWCLGRPTDACICLFAPTPCVTGMYRKSPLPNLLTANALTNIYLSAMPSFFSPVVRYMMICRVRLRIVGAYWWPLSVNQLWALRRQALTECERKHDGTGIGVPHLRQSAARCRRLS